MHKNILIISPPFRPNIGGVETHLDDLVKEGAKHGLTFTILTYQPIVTKAVGKFIENGSGFKIVRLPWPRFNLFLRLEKFPVLEFVYLFPGLFLTSLFYLMFVDNNFRVIHAQGLVSGAISVIMGKLFRKKVILSTHSIYSFPSAGFFRSFSHFIFSQCDHILTLSNQSKKEVVGLGVDANKVSVFTYWVDQKVFVSMKKADMRKSLGLPNSAFICLFVGRLVEGKGLVELMAAARITPKATFLIVGDGPLANKIKAKKTKIKNLIFIGSVDNNILPVYYNAANLLIIPSTHEEGFGRVILEALSCGLPVLGSNRGAIPEAVNNKVSTLINISPLNIKKAVEYLVNNRIKLASMSVKARKFAKAHYSNRNIEMITKFY